MFPNRAPSNPNGRMYASIPRLDTRASSKFKYNGLQSNVYNVDLSSPLGLAFFHSDNIEIIQSELYSLAVQQLKGKIDKTSIIKPSGFFIYQKCNDFYPMYAPTVHDINDPNIQAQVRKLNAILIAHMLPTYISEISGNQRYLKSLNELPVFTEAPQYCENTSHRELVNRSVRMGENPEPLVFSSKNTRVQSAHNSWALPHNPWLAARLPNLYGDRRSTYSGGSEEGSVSSL
jgi:hypothetical protein